MSGSPRYGKYLRMSKAHGQPDNQYAPGFIFSWKEKHAGTRVHATAATIDGIRETAEIKRAYWTPIVGADYPQRLTFPDVTVSDGQHLNIDGVELVVDDFGPTECSDNTAIELPQIDAVIISDLVYNRVHPWLAEGRSERWLDALAEASRRFGSAKVLYAGHGPAGSPSIIDEQAAYINAARETVARATKEDPALSDRSKRAIQQRMRSAYKNWPLEMIIDMNMAGLAGEIRWQAETPIPAVT